MVPHITALLMALVAPIWAVTSKKNGNLKANILWQNATPTFMGEKYTTFRKMGGESKINTFVGM